MVCLFGDRYMNKNVVSTLFLSALIHSATAQNRVKVVTYTATPGEVESESEVYFDGLNFPIETQIKDVNPNAAPPCPERRAVVSNEYDELGVSGKRRNRFLEIAMEAFSVFRRRLTGQAHAIMDLRVTLHFLKTGILPKRREESIQLENPETNFPFKAVISKGFGVSRFRLPISSFNPPLPS